MATTRTRKIQRLSRKGLVPIHFRITPELKAKLVKSAKQEGMSFTAYISLVTERFVLQRKIEQAVDKELERILAPLMFQAAATATSLRQTNRILKRALDNPLDDIDTIVKEVEELDIN